MADLEPNALEELAFKDTIFVANGKQICEEVHENRRLKNEGESLSKPERKDTPANGAVHPTDNLSVHGSEEGQPGNPDFTGEGDVAKEEEVLCDFCLTEKMQAVKSCLTCMVNYCQDHLQPHLEIAKLQTHKLMDPLKDIDMQSCEAHKSHLSWFCESDLACVCEECLADGHQGHKAVTCGAARKEKEVNILISSHAKEMA